MSPTAWIIAVFSARYLLDTTAEILNLRTFSPDLPAEFQGVYDREKYSKSLDYQRTNHIFDLIQSTFSFIALIAFLLSGGFEWMDELARRFGYGEISSGLIFAALFAVLNFTVSLPFSVYKTFSIEARFGFNRTTSATFILDIIKGTALGGILGGAVFAGLIYFFANTGSFSWLYAWLAFTAFQLFLLFIAPVWIMPLFNRFSPIADGELKQAIENYTAAQNFQLQGVFTMDNSKRSTKGNAYFTGFGKFRRLVLFDTLIHQQTVEELIAVVAHEIGHFKLKHILKSTLLSIVTSAVLFYCFGIFLGNRTLFAAFRIQQTSTYASLILIVMLFGPISRVLGIFTHLLSRKYEFDADEYSVKTYGKSEVMVSALKKLSIDNMSHLTPHPLKVFLDYTHPPILQRIVALRRAQG